MKDQAARNATFAGDVGRRVSIATGAPVRTPSAPHRGRVSLGPDVRSVRGGTLGIAADGVSGPVAGDREASQRLLPTVPVSLVAGLALRRVTGAALRPGTGYHAQSCRLSPAPGG
ncbi:hypothetical protein Airi01_080080 [Actinoallomurus iriomotensis]|uniref:Uncharacterized protein n=1 Tax=Actinoallomurus iriomotensis TaxID=478107 RepID=A0A9W6RPQ1_9ACTN|nr:hypothetical protein Airi01_080080 [Actinoallomurus iriomotensis]